MNKTLAKYFFLWIFILSFDLALCGMVKIGEKAPAISLMKLENREYFESEKLLGEKNMVICFFSTWSKPFNKEIPNLIKMSKEFDDDCLFLLVAVKEKKPLVRDYIARRDIPLQVVMDKFGKTIKNFGGKEVPMVVVIDKNGLITYHRTGYEKGDEIKLTEHLNTDLK